MYILIFWYNFTFFIIYYFLSYKIFHFFFFNPLNNKRIMFLFIDFCIKRYFKKCIRITGGARESPSLRSNSFYLLRHVYRYLYYITVKLYRINLLICGWNIVMKRKNNYIKVKLVIWNVIKIFITIMERNKFK